MTFAITVELGPQSMALLTLLSTNQEKTMSSLTDLAAAVANMDTVVASVLTDVTSLTAEIAKLNSGSNPAIDSAVSDINAKMAALQAAVVPGSVAPAVAPAAA